MHAKFGSEVIAKQLSLVLLLLKYLQKPTAMNGGASEQTMLQDSA